MQIEMKAHDCEIHIKKLCHPETTIYKEFDSD